MQLRLLAALNKFFLLLYFSVKVSAFDRISTGIIIKEKSSPKFRYNRN